MQMTSLTIWATNTYFTKKWSIRKTCAFTRRFTSCAPIFDIMNPTFTPFFYSASMSFHRRAREICIVFYAPSLFGITNIQIFSRPDSWRCPHFGSPFAFKFKPTLANLLALWHFHQLHMYKMNNYPWFTPVSNNRKSAGRKPGATE